MSAIRTTKNLRITFLRQTLRQEIGYFDSSEAGSITGHVTTNVNLVNQGISEKLGLTIQAIATFVTAFIVAFAVQWKLTLITIAVVPTILIVTFICMAIDTKQENQIMAIYARAGRLAEEIMASIRNVHAFWAFEKLSTKYESILDEARVVGLKKSPNYAVLFSVEFFCIFAGYGLAFWQGIRMFHSGEITQPGNIVTYVGLWSWSRAPQHTIANIYTQGYFRDHRRGASPHDHRAAAGHAVQSHGCSPGPVRGDRPGVSDRSLVRERIRTGDLRRRYPAARRRFLVPVSARGPDPEAADTLDPCEEGHCHCRCKRLRQEHHHWPVGKMVCAGGWVHQDGRRRTR